MKATEIAPQTTPKSASAGSEPILTACVCVAASCATAPKSGSDVPSMLCTVAAANTAAITMGMKVRSERSRRTTSSVKKIPVSGALNTAASPAADPQPTSVVMRVGSSRNTRPTTLAKVAPMVTIGPSGPADPPETIVADAPSQVRIASLKGSTACLRWIAYSTLETPCAFNCTFSVVMTMPHSKAPTIGPIPMSRSPVVRSRTPSSAS